IEGGRRAAYYNPQAPIRTSRLEMQPGSPDPIQRWLDRHRAGGSPSLDELCRFCEGRIRQLVHPQLQKFPLVGQDSQTTDVLNETLLRLLAALDDDVTLPSTLDLERFLAGIIRRVLLDMNKAIQRRRRRVSLFGRKSILAPEDQDDLVDSDRM